MDDYSEAEAKDNTNQDGKPVDTNSRQNDNDCIKAGASFNGGTETSGLKNEENSVKTGDIESQVLGQIAVVESKTVGAETITDTDSKSVELLGEDKEENWPPPLKKHKVKEIF